jgi:Baseplate J-like protein
MALPALDVDTRRYADLVAEGLSVLPRVAPEWTDHNAHDPGITLMELLAWTVEQEFYRANRTSDRARRKFLDLIGHPPEPARPAKAPLSFGLAPGAGQRLLPAGVVLAPAGADLPFRTTDALTITRSAVVATQSFDGARFAETTDSWRDRLPFHACGEDPGEGAALLVGLNSVPASAAELTLWVGIDGRRQPEGGALAQPAGVWECLTAAGWAACAAEDPTGGLTTPGLVRLALPPGTAPSQVGEVADACVWVRCRRIGDRFDAAPTVVALDTNAVPAEQSLPAGGGLQVQLGLATGLPNQRVDLPGGQLANGAVRVWTAEPGGNLEWAPREDFDSSGPLDRHVQLDLFARELRFGGGERGRVPPVGAAVLAEYAVTAGARVSAPTAGAWRFWPEAEAVNQALLGAETATVQEKLSAIVALQPGRAGADAEDVPAAFARASAHLWAHERLLELCVEREVDSLDEVPRDAVLARPAPERATTALDFERIALEVPDTRVARARAFAGLDVRHGCLSAPGVVSLVLVPSLPLGRPQPSRTLLARVRRHLDPRRVLGTALVVAGPVYVEVSVRARVRGRPATDPVALRADLREACDGFLHPLHGGSRGVGWPFGRDVYRSELLQLLDGVAGVEHVLELELVAAGTDAGCGNACVPPAGLVSAGEHELEVVA